VKRQLVGFWLIYTCLGDSLSNFAIGRPVAKISDSEGAFATTAHWLQDFVEAHYTCRPPSITAPTRLVHVGSLDTEPHILIPIGEGIQLATLSHCWEISWHGITTSANIEDRKKKAGDDTTASPSQRCYKNCSKAWA
jgi:hypothetical protein